MVEGKHTLEFAVQTELGCESYFGKSGLISSDWDDEPARFRYACRSYKLRLTIVAEEQ